MDPSHMSGVSVDCGGGSDRFPQWSMQETRDFLMIRAELDPTFMETKRNKVLWEVISTKMKERGYNRSGEQCKCKWKNLVTRYKGFETMEQEGTRQQFPYYNELQAIFTGRMQRMVWMESEGLGIGSSKKRVMDLCSEDEDESDVETHKKKKKITSTKGIDNNNNNTSNLKEVLQELMKQQMQIEMQWMKTYEAKEEERRTKEREWRQRMEALENQRIVFERRWQDREEQRRIREESRSEKRDALITALLNKFKPEDNL